MEKILIVDDDPEILELIADVLRQGGYDVDEAKDGRKALRLIEDDFYDLVMTDRC
jgi:DNA-binding response OmpR family regulator